MICPSCAKEIEIPGTIGFGDYPLENGKIRIYAYLLCMDCSKILNSLSSELRKTMLEGIEQYFLESGLFEVGN